MGATWAQPNLQGCTEATLGVAHVGAGTGVTLGTVVVCSFGVMGVVGVTGRGCGSCPGLGVQVVVQKYEVWQEPEVQLL